MKKTRKFYAVEYQEGFFTSPYEYSKSGLEYVKKHIEYLKEIGYAKPKMVVFKVKRGVK